MQDTIPTRPADQARTSLRDQLVCHESHLAPPVNTRLGIGEPARVGRLGSDALDAHMCGQALADQPMAMRWVTVAEARAYGSPVSHAAAALGLEIAEVAAGLRSWTDGQHQHAGCSAAARDEVHALPDHREVGR